MMPMLIGHSQGGMLAIRVLYELAGDVRRGDCRSWIPRTGERAAAHDDRRSADRRDRGRSSGLTVPYAAALATGKLPRVLLGQWSMLPRLREIPDTRRRIHRLLDRGRSDRRQPARRRAVPRDGHRARAQRHAAGDATATSALPRTRASRRRSGHARVDRRVRTRRARAARRRRASTRRTSCTPPTSGTASRSTGASRRSARCAPRDAAQADERPAQPVPGGDAALARAASVQRRARRRRCGSRSTPRRLEAAIGAQLAARRTHRPRRSTPRARATNSAADPPCIPLEVVDGGRRCHAALRREIERQLNLPFPADGAIEPFRFFALADAGDAFRLGLAYDHFIAGGDSIVVLLQRHRRALRRAPAGAPAARSAIRRRSAPARARNALRVRARPRRAAGADRELPSRRRGRAIRRRGDGHNGVRVRRASTPAESATLASRARRRGASRSTTCCSRSCSGAGRAGRRARGARASGARDRASRRSSTCAARIGLDTRDAFGQFLSSFRVSHPVPAGIALGALARDVHRETQRIKTRKLLPADAARDARQRHRVAVSARRVAAGASTPRTTRCGPGSRRSTSTRCGRRAKAQRAAGLSARRVDRARCRRSSSR